MDHPGAELKKIRLEKGISLEEVQKKTKIHLNILKAMEGDSITNLSPIYIKGFLKIYCNLLGVDPKKYSLEAKLEPKKEPKAEAKGRTPAARKVEGKKALLKEEPPSTTVVPKPSAVSKQGEVLLKKASRLLRAVRQAGSKVLKGLKAHLPVIKKVLLSAVAVAIALFILSSCVRFVSARYKAFKERRKTIAVRSIKQPVKTAPPKTASKETTKPSVPAVVPVTEVAAKTPVSAAESKTMPKQVSSVIRLGVRAKGNCWILVKVDGKVVFQRTLEKGRFESWQAKDRIELSVGNAAAVDLEINGQLFSNLGRKGQALKNILITKDGLKTAL